MRTFCFQIRTVFLLLVVAATLSGCDGLFSPSREPGEIPFVLTGVKESSCPIEIAMEGETWQVDYFGFYLSNPEIRIDGRWHPIKFKAKPWQTPTTALLNFQNACAQNPESQQSIVLNASEKLMKLATNLRFTLAIPFDNNHVFDESGASPLSNKDMYLNAQNGHRFMRLDMHKVAKPDHQFSYHLGSAGCESVSLDHAPNEACAFTNRIEFILPMLQFDTELTLELSISNIVSQIEVNDRVQECVFSSPETAPCEQLMRNLLQRPWIQWDDNVYKI